MPHRSENSVRLERDFHTPKRWSECCIAQESQPALWIVHLPCISCHARISEGCECWQKLSELVRKLHKASILCVLTRPADACELIDRIRGSIQFKLWIGVERNLPVERPTALPDHHVSLVVFTKKPGSLQHNKTQIAYTLCPACGKTTKDYGGKKHLYDPYGTLMSDVWRDIVYQEETVPGEILDRIADVFGIEPFRCLHYIDLRQLFPGVVKKNVHEACEGTNDPGTSRLIQSDCLGALRTIPDNSIDFAFADPPYNIRKKYDQWDDSQELNEYFQWCDSWIAELARVLSPGRTLAIMNIPLWAVRHYVFAKTLLDFQDWIAWEGLGLPVRQIMPAHYGILCMSKGKPAPVSNCDNELSQASIGRDGLGLKKWYCLRRACVKRRNSLAITDRQSISNLWWDIHRLKHNSRRVDHPCQLPPALMLRLIHTFSRTGEVVLDPFNGAGTTTLVAELLGRRYIGIELSAEYHRLAMQRHRELKRGVDPFANGKPTPQSKNSRVSRVKKQRYVVPKKTLQLEVKEIAQKIGRKPTREDVEQMSKYPIRFFDEYFIDWGEVCGAVGDKGMSDSPDRETSRRDYCQAELSFDDG